MKRPSCRSCCTGSTACLTASMLPPRRVLAELFAAHFGQGARPSLLDVGCGVGRLHAHLSEVAGRLAGTDSSWTSIARARFDNPRVDYREGAEGKVPWPDASFDVTLAVCILHHVAAA